MREIKTILKAIITVIFHFVSSIFLSALINITFRKTGIVVKETDYLNINLALIVSIITVTSIVVTLLFNHKENTIKPWLTRVMGKTYKEYQKYAIEYLVLLGKSSKEEALQEIRNEYPEIHTFGKRICEWINLLSHETRSKEQKRAADLLRNVNKRLKYYWLNYYSYYNQLIRIKNTLYEILFFAIIILPIMLIVSIYPTCFKYLAQVTILGFAFYLANLLFFISFFLALFFLISFFRSLLSIVKKS